MKLSTPPNAALCYDDMIMRFEDSGTQAEFELCCNEPTALARHAYNREKSVPQYVIMWNRGKQQRLTVDGVDYTFRENMLVAIGIFQAYLLE